MERYKDALAELTDADLKALHEPLPELAPPPRNEWWLKFQYDLYDWDDPAWKEQNKGKYAWLPIKLTQGYFAMVSLRHYKKYVRYTWHANVQRDPETKEIIRVYARRCKPKHRNVVIYMHIDVAKSGPLAFVDHVDGYSLDNRWPNFHTTTSHSLNMANHVGQRRKQFGLPQGIYHRPSGKYQARLNYTIRGQSHEKNRSFKTVEAAVRWRKKEREKLFKRSKWVDTPKSISFPVFPPLRKKPEALMLANAPSLTVEASVETLVATF